MDHSSPIQTELLAPAPRLDLRVMLRRNLGPALVVLGLAFTVLWIGLMAYGAMMLAGLAI